MGEMKTAHAKTFENKVLCLASISSLKRNINI